MTVNELKERVCAANLLLPKHGLVTFTWGNVSAYDKQLEMVAIKPSGVSYEEMKPEHMVVLDLQGNVIEGDLRPSSDTQTHLHLYRTYPELGGIVHTHSRYATSWAQAKLPIPALGTTHADYFADDVPVTRPLTEQEIEEAYELETGKVIVETLGQDCEVLAVPGVLVSEHAPFAWGNSPEQAVHNAVVLEEVACMAYMTRLINPQVSRVSDYLLRKHYLRKHGKNAYYGQSK